MSLLVVWHENPFTHVQYEITYIITYIYTYNYTYIYILHKHTYIIIYTYIYRKLLCNQFMYNMYNMHKLYIIYIHYIIALTSSLRCAPPEFRKQEISALCSVLGSNALTFASAGLEISIGISWLPSGKLT